MIRVVLLTEVNSRLGSPFFSTLIDYPEVSLVGVVTSPTGRPCPYFLGEEEQVDVAAQAELAAVPVFRPERVNDPQTVQAIAALNPDYLLIGNYQQILKPALLDVPRVATLNFHPSPLPRYAGWAPFFWMAKAGEQHSGVTAILVTPEIDAGPIVRQRPIRLAGEETALEIRESHIVENVALLREVIPTLLDRSFTVEHQDRSVRTYFGKPGDEDYRLDFTGGALPLLRTVRAGYRRPGAFAITNTGERVTILSADTRFRKATEPPLARPGTVYRDRDILVAAADRWVRLVTVEEAGREIPARLPAVVRTLSGSPVPAHLDRIDSCCDQHAQAALPVFVSTRHYGPARLKRDSRPKSDHNDDGYSEPRQLG